MDFGHVAGQLPELKIHAFNEDTDLYPMKGSSLKYHIYARISKLILRFIFN